MYRNVPTKSNKCRRWPVLGEHQHQRSFGIGKINLSAKPRTKLGQKKLTKWEKMWRWIKSIGVLILVGIALFVAVCYSDNDGESSMEMMEKLSRKLGEKLPIRNEYLHNGKISKTSKRNSVNVVLLTHPWLGSGLIGDLLTLTSEAAYFLEPSPLWAHNKMMKLTPQELLSGIFNCHQGVLRKLSTARPFKIIRKLTPSNPNVSENSVRPWRETDATLTSRCSKSKLIIVETGKLKLSSLISLVNDQVLKIKIIHVVRDPRIISESSTVRSVTSNGVNHYTNSEEFQDELRRYCFNLGLDLESGRVLNRKQYLVLHYQDLRDEPMAFVRRAYNFLGISTWYPSVRDYFRKHRNGRKWKYFEDITKSANRKAIDKECKKAIKLLSMFQSTNKLF